MVGRVSLVAVVLVAAGLALVALGGVVHSTGSSLACPDWPLCHGEWLPAMRGGVEYEHSHRLLALALSVGVAWLAWAARSRPRSRRVALTALCVVVLQALLGGATVVLRLPPPISIAHRLMATTLLALLLSVGLSGLDPAVRPAPARRRRAAEAAASVVFLQIGLGALVRHFGAGLACADDPIGCAPLGAGHPAAILHVVHRVIGLVALGLVVRVALIALREGPAAAFTARSVLALSALQIGLGVASVRMGLAIVPVALHVVVADVVLLGLLVLRVELPPVPRPAPLTLGESARTHT